MTHAQIRQLNKNPYGPPKSFDEEVEELKQNNSRIWFNFATNTPGVIFIKLHEAMRDHIDVHKLMEHLIS